MAEVRPFRALRYNTDKAGGWKTLCCPPYDIISPQEQQEYYNLSPYNFIRLELGQGQDRYAEAAGTLQNWIDQDILRRDGQNMLYFYQEEFTSMWGGRLKLGGFMARVRLEEFSKGVVLPHEETLPKAKSDRLSLMKKTACNFSQIYALYLDSQRAIQPLVDAAMAGAADFSFEDKYGIVHSIWTLPEGAETDKICAHFTREKLFIADGHHRYETALNYRDYLRDNGIINNENDDGNYIMMMLVSMGHPGLEVHPTHRLVHSLQGFDLQKLLDGLESDFQSEKSALSSVEEELLKREDTVALYAGGDEVYFLKSRNMHKLKEILPGKSDAYCGLDVSLLHSMILEPHLGIDEENMRQQKNLAYTRSIAEAVESVETGASDCAFLLNPTKIGQIIAVSEAGEKMPQKSTYFYPKIMAGLVMNQILERP